MGTKLEAPISAAGSDHRTALSPWVPRRHDCKCRAYCARAILSSFPIIPASSIVFASLSTTLPVSHQVYTLCSKGLNG
jgi:hypothetical protein